MDNIIRVIAFVGILVSLGNAIFIIASDIKIKRMKKINKELDLYIKKRDYLLMKNDGENLCEIKSTIHMPLFSQQCDYVVRRKSV